MTRQQWDHLSALFDAAQAIPVAERPQQLDRLCGGDAALLHELQALLRSDDEAGDFLTSGPTSADLGLTSAAGPSDPPAWQEGTIIAGRFVLGALLGRGGAGEVYRAYDRELNCTVALKLMRAGLTDPRWLDRFKREVLMARLISHPHICRVHDWVVHPGPPVVYCLSMELIEGDSLAAWLAEHGAAPAAQARRWLAGIASGLDAAHAAGIIHRDLKPANILLRPTPERGGRDEAPGASSPVERQAGGVEPPRQAPRQSIGALEPVITDFGLARRSLTPEAADTSGTQPIGTLAYMAPEQLQGDPLTPAVDIYAFGLLAIELLTGKRRFGGCGLGGIWQRATGLEAALAADGIPAAWHPLLAGCLALDPADRFASACLALAAAPQDVAITPADAPAPPPPRPRPRWRWLPWAAAAVFLLSLGWGLLRHYKVMPSVPQGSEILLTPVVNASQDAQLDGLNAMLQQQLAQSGHFRVMTDTSIRYELARMGKPAGYGPAALAQQPALARELALRTGARLVVFAALTRVAGRYRLELELERVGADPDVAAGRWVSEQQAAAKDDLPAAVYGAANWVRRMAGEAPAALAARDPAPQDITTANWTALSFYTEAEQARAAGHTDPAVALLRQAVAADPHFALAYARLGDILVSEQHNADGLAAYRQALRPGDIRRLSQRERLRIEGAYATDVDNFAGAVQAFQAYAGLYPDDYLGWFYQGWPDAELGRPARAYAAWDRADASDPHQYFAAANRAMLQIWQGRLAQASASSAAVRRLGGGSNADLLDASIAFVRGDDTMARQFAARLAAAASPYWRDQGALLEADLDAERGRYRRAEQTLHQSLASSGNEGGHAAAVHLALAYLALQSGARAQVQHECAAALALRPGPRQVAQAGMMLARAGDLAGARVALARLRPDAGLQPLAATAAAAIRGEILLSQKLAPAAVEQMQFAARHAGALESPEPLARALAADGQSTAALHLYDAWSLTPARLWHLPVLQLPGSFADLLFAAARLSDQMHAPDAAARYRRYLQFRAAADPELPDVVFARRRLARLSRLAAHAAQSLQLEPTQ